MYILKIKSSFDSAHKLPNYDGLCANLHGHRWSVICNIVYARTKNNGMCCDFKQLKKEIGAILKNYDHTYLNDFIENPTAENIAENLFHKIKQNVKDLYSIEIYETPDCCVEYKI